MSEFESKLISAQGLKKSYRLGGEAHNPLGLFKRMLQGRENYAPEKLFWALKGVDFEVERGEAVAIIGRNGAGKSTLLRLIAGVAHPDGGEISVRGKVAALLDLGVGLDGELTGRENIDLSASILGMESEDIDSERNSIIDFAELGEFIERPVKTYSSGMRARLGFSIAAHVNADILIVDEVLAVGDAAFQQKCMRFIRQFTKKGALLFVSHDIASVTSLCTRALWLEAGEVKMYGSAADVCHAYQVDLAGKMAGEAFVAAGGRRVALLDNADFSPDFRAQAISNSPVKNSISLFEFDPDSVQFGARNALINRAQITLPGGELASKLEGGEEVTLTIACEAVAALEEVIVGFYFKNHLGQNLFGDNTLNATWQKPIGVDPGAKFYGVFEFRLPYLPPGDYAVAVAVATGNQDDHVIQHWLDEALFLRIATSHIRHSVVGLPMKRISLELAGKDAHEEGGA